MIPPSQAGYGCNSLPNHVREQMLQTGVGKGLVVLEALYMLKLKSESWLTFNQIYRLCSDNFSISRRMVYEGLRQPLIFQRRKAPGIADRRGARPYIYRVPTRDEIIVEFGAGLRHSPTDELQRADLRGLTSYRQALHREMFIRRWIANSGQGFSMSRKLMAERLGVSTRTIRTYDKLLGHSHEPQYHERQITWDNWYALPRYKNQYDQNGKRLPSKFWLKAHRYLDDSQRTLPLVRYLAYQSLTEGFDVYVVERLPNVYYPYQKPDLSAFESWDAVSHHFAEMEARNAAGLYKHNDGSWYHQRE